MVLRDILNPSSPLAQLAYGVSGMGASYIPLAQSAAMHGLERYGVALWGVSTFALGLMITGTAVQTVFNYLQQRGREESPAPVPQQYSSVTAVAAPVWAAQAAKEAVKERLNGRLVDAVGGVVMAGLLVAMEPAAGKVAGAVCLAFSACKAGAAAWDFACLRRAQRSIAPAP